MTSAVRLDDLITLVKNRHPDGDALERLGDAVSVGEHLGEVADHLIGHFVDQARRAVVEAQAAARRCRQEQIGPEHLVLGLLTEPTALAATTLTALGVDLDVLRERVEAGLVASDAELGEQIPFSGPAKKVLELVFREALRVGHDYVGTEHLLLGLLVDEESQAAQLLGVTHAAAEAQILSALAAIVAASDAAAE